MNNFADKNLDKAIELIDRLTSLSAETSTLLRVKSACEYASELGLNDAQANYAVEEALNNEETSKFLIRQLILLQKDPLSGIMPLLAQFHTVFKHESVTKDQEVSVRPTLIREEAAEVLEALEEGDLPHIAQELADLVYVTYGTALVFGIDLDAAVREVHRANMSKLDEDGNPIFREDGKVLKSSLYTLPDLTGAIVA